MGAKIPFRFPMVDTLVPTVQMYDVSRLVSAPVEARAMHGTTNDITVLLDALKFELLALSAGGLFVENLILDARIATPAPLFGFPWSFQIRPSGSLPQTQGFAEEMGGSPTRSEVFSDVSPWVFKGNSAILPPQVSFQSAPRFFVPVGSRLILQSPVASPGDRIIMSITWSELPTSFEES